MPFAVVRAALDLSAKLTMQLLHACRQLHLRHKGSNHIAALEGSSLQKPLTLLLSDCSAMDVSCNCLGMWVTLASL